MPAAGTVTFPDTRRNTLQAIGLIFGGISVGSSVFFGFLLVVIALGVLVLFGRRRQAKAQANRAAQIQR